MKIIYIGKKSPLFKKFKIYKCKHLSDNNLYEFQSEHYHDHFPKLPITLRFTRQQVKQRFILIKNERNIPNM